MGTVRVGEVAGKIKDGLQGTVSEVLTPSAPSECLAPLCRNPGEASLDRRIGFLDAPVGHLLDENDAGRTFIDGLQPDLALFGNDTVIFPVTDLFASLDSFRPLFDGRQPLLPFQLPGLPETLFPSSLVSSGKKGSQVFLLRLHGPVSLPADLGIDVLVDGFVRDSLPGMVERETESDLFRRPAELQLLYRILPDRLVLQSFIPLAESPLQGTFLGRSCSVCASAPPWPAPDLPGHGARRTTDFPGDSSETEAVPIADLYAKTLLEAQMRKVPSRPLRFHTTVCY